MPRCDTDIAAVRLARQSQNETGSKRQSARLEPGVFPSLRDPVVMDQRSAATCPCQWCQRSGLMEGVRCA